MKVTKIVFWISTVLVAAGMLMSSVMYLTANPQITQGFALLGYPSYIIYLLGTLKLLGAIVLVVPRAGKLKEWAYAGFAFCFVGALWSHLATHTPFIAPLVFLALLFISYFMQAKLVQKKDLQTNWATA